MFKKEAAVCQIPGFTYNHQPVPQLLVKPDWVSAPLEQSILENWNLEKIDQRSLEYNKELTEGSLHHVKMATWKGFQSWCKTFGICSAAQLGNAPLRIKKMLKDKVHSAKIMNRLERASLGAGQVAPKKV